jgi:transposase-like protein
MTSSLQLIFCPMSQRIRCPFCTPKIALYESSPPVVRRGWYRRQYDGRQIQRYACKVCHKTFSSLTLKPFWRQQKPYVNDDLIFLLCSGFSQRRAARKLEVDPKTIARRLLLLADLARVANKRHLARRGPVERVCFDDMESSIHTKLKPVSIPLTVEKNTREIISLRVCSMPAKGLLAEKSRKKYGPRKDDRRAARLEVLGVVASIAAPKLIVTSDKCPQYRELIRGSLPGAKHVVVKGRRGCVVGQGELKKIGFDPLFFLNQTAAMVRANVNRLVRKTWCTSKRMDRLQDHMDLYVWFHNQYLVKNPANKKPPGKVPRLRPLAA